MTPSSTPRRPVLELDAVVPVRATVKIRSSKSPRGKLYELVHPNSLSLADQQFFYETGERIQSLLPKDLDEDELAELELLVDKVARIVLPAADADGVLDALGVWQKLRLIEAFTEASAVTPTRTRRRQTRTASTRAS